MFVLKYLCSTLHAEHQAKAVGLCRFHYCSQPLCSLINYPLFLVAILLYNVILYRHLRAAETNVCSNGVDSVTCRLPCRATVLHHYKLTAQSAAWVLTGSQHDLFLIVSSCFVANVPCYIS